MAKAKHAETAAPPLPAPADAVRETDREVISALSELRRSYKIVDVVRKFAPDILAAHDRGASWSEIARTMTECGYPMTLGGLQGTLYKILKKEGAK